MSNIQQKVQTASNSIVALGKALEESRKAKIGEKKNAGEAGKIAKQAIADLVADRDCLFLPPQQLNKSLENMENSLKGFSRITLRNTDQKNGKAVNNAFDEAITQVHTMRDNAKVIANVKNLGYSEEHIKNALKQLSCQPGAKIDQKALEEKCEEHVNNALEHLRQPREKTDQKALKEKCEEDVKNYLKKTYSQAIVEEVAHKYQSNAPYALEQECEKIINSYAPPIPEEVKKAVSWNSDEVKSNPQKSIELFLNANNRSTKYEPSLVNDVASKIHNHRKEEMKSKESRSKWTDPKSEPFRLEKQAVQLHKACQYADFKNTLCEKYNCTEETFNQAVKNSCRQTERGKNWYLEDLGVGKRDLTHQESELIELELQKIASPAS